jgi:hypothetical protein
MFPIDPTADPGRRAWFNCPECRHGVGCDECLSNRNCQAHWQFLLGSQAWTLHLQCPDCGHLWSIDSSPPGRRATGAA